MRTAEDYTFDDIYKYCAHVLSRTYKLSIAEYGYEVYTSYLQAKKSFNPEKGGNFPFWVSKYLQGKLRTARKLKKDAMHNLVADSDDYMVNAPDNNKSVEHHLIYKDIIDSSHKIIKDYHSLGKTLREIAKDMGISRAYVYHLKTEHTERLAMKIKLEEYVKRSAQTALYKPGSLYPYFGLVGEAGELLEHIIKIKTTMYVDMKEFKKELGDVLWYVAAILRDNDIEIQAKQTRTMDIVEDVLHLVNHASKIAEVVKKAIRDNNGVIEKNKLKEPLYYIIGLIEAIAKKSGTTIEVIGDMNIDKLLSRQSRGVLNGSGDNR